MKISLCATGCSEQVEATYPIEEIKAALEHAGREGRAGKMLVAPNGAIG